MQGCVCQLGPHAGEWRRQTPLIPKVIAGGGKELVACRIGFAQAIAHVTCGAVKLAHAAVRLFLGCERDWLGPKRGGDGFYLFSFQIKVGYPF